MLIMSLIATMAFAQDTVDIGVLKDTDIKVVQKVLHPKAGRSELGFSLGLMPFDPFLTTPNLQVSFDLHQSEVIALGGVIGVGYGVENAYFNELQNPENQRTPYAFRYLGSALLGVQVAPIYGKMSLGGNKVLHYDTYGAVRAGVTIESSVIPDGGVPVSPTLSFAIGTRIFASKKGVLRLEIRDDMFVQSRPITNSVSFKQNLNLQIGWTFLSAPKGS